MKVWIQATCSYGLETNISASETTAELWDRLANMGAELLVETLDTLDSIAATPQDHSQATYAPLIQKSLGHIDWNKPATQLHNLIRGCVSWPVAQCGFRDKTLKIWKSQVSDVQSTTPPGTVVQVKPRPIISTGKGCLDYWKSNCG